MQFIKIQSIFISVVLLFTITKVSAQKQDRIEFYHSFYLQKFEGVKVVNQVYKCNPSNGEIFGVVKVKKGSVYITRIKQNPFQVDNIHQFKQNYFESYDFTITHDGRYLISYKNYFIYDLINKMEILLPSEFQNKIMKIKYRNRDEAFFGYKENTTGLSKSVMYNLKENKVIKSSNMNKRDIEAFAGFTPNGKHAFYIYSDSIYRVSEQDNYCKNGAQSYAIKKGNVNYRELDIINDDIILLKHPINEKYFVTNRYFNEYTYVEATTYEVDYKFNVLLFRYMNLRPIVIDIYKSDVYNAMKNKIEEEKELEKRNSTYKKEYLRLLSKANTNVQIVSDRNEWLYIGDQKEGLANGFAEAITEDGSFYIKNGLFENGIFTQGILIDRKSGSQYIGRFLNEQLIGEGTFSTANGNNCSGYFVDGALNGKGSFLWNDGSIYSGDFIEGKLEGSGILFKPTGETFDGQFKNGVPHGSAIYIKNGIPERCEFYNGKRIDQAYLIRKENERVALERKYERLAEEERQRRISIEQLNAEKKANSASSFLGAFALDAGLSLLNMSDVNQFVKIGANLAADAIKKNSVTSGINNVYIPNSSSYENSSKSNNSALIFKSSHCKSDTQYEKYFNKDCNACYNCSFIALAVCYYKATGNDIYLDHIELNKRMIYNFELNECPELTKLYSE